jgi:hypothetical protein
MSSGQIIIIIGRIFYCLSAEILYNTVSKSKMISGGKEKASVGNGFKPFPTDALRKPTTPQACAGVPCRAGYANKDSALI